MEASDIPERNKNKDQYKKYGKKLREFQDNALEEVQEQLREGVESSSSTNYLPEDLASYLLSLKQKTKLPVSILPSSLFKRPLFVGREDFFHRLASELISFGIAYQRVYLAPIRLSKLAEHFHRHRPWWKCDIQDIEKALDVLLQNRVVQKTHKGFLFEPLSLSSDVQEFLAIISKGLNEYGEISLSSIQKLVPWNSSKIDKVLELLYSNKICIIDRSKGSLFFPDLKTGM